MDKEKALDKIKKCLALSRSANEHEAAQALKHAQALMDKYGVRVRALAQHQFYGRQLCVLRAGRQAGTGSIRL